MTCACTAITVIAAVALRAQLRLLFPKSLSSSSWIDLSGVDLTAFGRPKGVALKTPLLWTAQAEVLWRELCQEPDGDSYRGQILAGPSGIGKSHISLLLALRCYSLGIPVLYVPDAGELLSASMRILDSNTILRFFIGLPGLVDVFLLCSFAILNADVAPSALLSLFFATILPASISVHQLLDRCRAVVVLDEHGHAYNAMV
jgi:hypothetical protein